MPTPFDYDLGVSQGRIRPVNSSPVDGQWVFCLGSDLQPPPEFRFAFGNYVEVSQAVDLTSIYYIRGVWRIRQPLTMPAPLTLPVGTYLQHGGIAQLDPLLPVGADPRHARLGVGAGASALTYWAVEAGEPGTHVEVEHVTLGPSRPLEVQVFPHAPPALGAAIRVILATDAGGVATSTAAEVADAVNHHTLASQFAFVAAGGAGLVGTLVNAPLVLTDDRVDAIVTPVDFFTPDMDHRLVRISGAANPGNDGDKVIVGVWPRVAILDSVVVSEGAGFAAVMPGALWKVSARINAEERVAYTPLRATDFARTDLVVHVSKLVGVYTVAFRLTLVEETP